MLVQTPFDDVRVREAVQQALPGYLPTQRWFGDKAREIDAVEIVAAFDIPGLAIPAAFAVIEVAFRGGGGVRYGMPLAVNPTHGAGVVCTVTLDGEQAFVRDALLEPGFRAWVLELLIAADARQTGAGRLLIDRPERNRLRLEKLRSAASRVLGAEQSNSSLVFGNDVFVKLFRRLQPGVNPDVELTRFLTVKAGFEHTPPVLGSIAYESPEGDSTVVAVAQEFVESVGDGWAFVIAMLERHIGAGESPNSGAESKEVARRLGEITAHMHLALARDPWDDELAPESIRMDDTERWRAGYLEMLDAVAAGIRRAQSTMEPRTAELAGAFLELSSGLRGRAEAFDRLLGRAKTRVHGDYHLGQLLCTADRDFAVIDFEGEPQRPIAERRLKTSPLKDVAGMLRSFAYARGTVAAKLDAENDGRAADLVGWERLMRTDFLDAYLRTAAGGGATFLPSSPADIQAAVAAWELDKAVYEVQYELNNRPEWLWIPLSGMLKYGTPDS